ncbi:MAG: hypothetical protein JWO36_3039 [Myxococcales bacterium]|nr:hypothetical protein [Myxococcales bacterium]
MDLRSPVHEIVNALWRALHGLDSNVDTDDIERWGFSIHAALSAAGREFHNHDHVIEIAKQGDPLEIVAALYHDAVYIQVDQGPPRTMRVEMDRVLQPVADGWRVLPSATDHAVTADVLAVFGRKAGDVIAPTQGLNELASALVAALQLQKALDRTQRIAVAACIEQTIPFRIDPVTELHDRLVHLDLPEAAVDEILRRAVRFGNRDVENFADNEPARFLDNTWKLLPETNPALHSPMVYTVRDYRIALQKMEAFLALLPAERVFHSWGDEPKPEIHARRVARATGNLELAVRYLRAKLYAIALVEAIAETTGGDVPIDYFMGGVKQVDHPDMKRLEHYFPQLGSRADLDPPLHRLLAEGRASDSSFDTKPSPVGAFLHSTVGEAAMMKGVEMAKKWWAGALDPVEYLDSQPNRVVAAIARAAGNIIDTRRDRLFALAERLER